MNEKIKSLRTLDDIAVDGRDVLVRTDFNVSVGDDNIVDSSEDYRIEAALPTIRELQQKRCKIALLTHYGSEKDIKKGGFALDPIRYRLEDLLKESVKQIKSLYGNEVEAVMAGMEPGQVVMLDNVRSDEREISNNVKFAGQIANHFEAYVNEAFSVCHRAHASVNVLPTLLPSAAGRRTVQEIEAIDYLRDRAEHPYVAIASGSKITTKVNMLRKLLSSVDKLCVGGQIGNVFLIALDKYKSGLYEDEEINLAKELLGEFENKLVLPKDVVIGTGDGDKDKMRTVEISNIPEEAPGVWDIGPASVRQILDVCSDAKTVLWNGPVGMFEVEAYSEGTKALAHGLANIPAYRVVGGGETVSALELYRVVDKYDHVSVGGGAMIAYLEGKPMPGLDPLYTR